jgi:xanthine/uracil/vitamin C permease (AzgA family)
MNGIKKFFKLEENNTTISKEIIAGLTTFFTMVYIIFVNPNLLSISGIPWSAVFLATIIATVVGTLVMGLFANVPYALAPGMGLNAFFTFTVVLVLGFTWQEALGLVFICGLINILITVTKVRKSIIRAIPKFLQNAIGGGIGLFIAYIGLLNVGGITGGLAGGLVPSLSTFNNLPFLLAMIGLVLTIVLMLLKVRGSILIGIVGTTLIGLVVTLINPATALVPLPEKFVFDIGKPFVELFTSNNAVNEPVFLAAFRGIGGLFTDLPKALTSLFAIFAFSLTDTFDTIGTFVGTGRKSGIFTDEDVIVVASVSCIYGIGDPEDYRGNMLVVKQGQIINREEVIEKLISMQYSRNDYEIKRGTFRVKGDTIDVIPAYEKSDAIRLEFFDNEIEKIKIVDVITGKVNSVKTTITFFPATLFTVNEEKKKEAIKRIRAELETRIAYFKNNGQLLEAQRIESRTNYDY